MHLFCIQTEFHLLSLSTHGEGQLYQNEKNSCLSARVTGRALTPVTDRWLGGLLLRQLPNQPHAHPKPPEL